MAEEELLVSLAKRYGTPLYVYDLAVAEQRLTELRALLPVNARVLYALKANPLVALARVFAEQSCSAEVSSLGEVEIAAQAGFRVEQALFTGPAKSATDIALALRAGIRLFSCESLLEFRRLADAARQARLEVTTLLRVNLATPARAALSMTGASSQFGMTEADVVECARGGGGPSLRVEGFHFYLGTQMQGSPALSLAFDSAVTAALRLAERTGYPLRRLDLGGGFPWPYGVLGCASDLSAIVPRWSEWLSRLPAGCELWLESGRFLAASSGVLVTRVIDVKSIDPAKLSVVVDTGLHHLGGMSGIGRLIRTSFQIAPLSGSRASPVRADIVGPLCTPLDYLARDVELPAPSVGDLLMIPNVGAYGLTASLNRFLSREQPVEVITRRGDVCSAWRARWTMEAVEGG